MMKLLSLASGVFLLSQLLIGSARHRKGLKASLPGMLRALSCSGGCLLILEDGLFLPGITFPVLTLDLAIVGSLLLVIPAPGEPSRSAAGFVVLLLSGNLLLHFFPAFFLSGACWFLRGSVLGSLVCALSYLAFGALRGCVWNLSLLREDFAVRQMLQTSRLFYGLLLMGEGTFAGCSASCQGVAGSLLQACSFLGMLVLETLLYQRSVSGRFLVFGRRKDRGETREVPLYQDARTERTDEMQRMHVLYKRILQYMEEKQPYLDAEYDMNRMAKDLYSNKLYLSKTINLLSGRNFRQFVNRYRIRYAVELMKKDPRLKLMDVSEQAGFHTVVSFNMAFKINLGKTPSEWLRDYLASRSLGR